MLILTRYIAKYEFKPLRKHFSIDDILAGARKVIEGLGKKITPVKQQTDFHFFKVRISRSAKGRMIVLVVSQNKNIVPLLIRLEKDKKMGMNMSAQNPYVVAQIEKNLERVLKNIEHKDFEEFSLL